MGIDPNIEELKGKDVIAMETVEENIVDFHYLENGKVESKRIYGKRPGIFKKYALVCGMVWDGIRKGEGYEPCHDFKNGRLFVPLRGEKGVVHVREDQYKEICLRNGQTFISCKGGLEIPACKSHEGNRKKMEEAHEIAVNLGYYPETEMAGKAGVCKEEKVNPPAVLVSIPFAEPAEEASFMAHVLADAGLTADKLLMDCWLDMEDADGYKERYGIRDDRVITGMCRTFLEEMNSHGYPCGIYASYDWLTGCIHVDELPEHTAYWCAQWGHHCDFARAAVWQYTDRLEIGQRIFDGNLLLAEGRSFP